MINKLDLLGEYILEELKLLKRKPHLKNLIKRNIQVASWDKANTREYFTGMISEAALENGERVKEHWYGGTQLALDIMELENPTIDTIINDIKTKLTWNYTTADENQILKYSNQDYSKITPLVEYKK
jgi:predicted membrane protein